MQAYSSSEVLKISAQVAELKLYHENNLVILFYKPQLPMKGFHIDCVHESIISALLCILISYR